MQGSSGLRFELRHGSFEQQVVKMAVLLELPVAFAGKWDECKRFAESQGFIWKPDANILFRGYYWRDCDRSTLMVA